MDMRDARFDQQLDELMKKCGMDSLQVQLGDSHRHAHIKGVHEGLRMARELFKKLSRQDIEDPDL